MPHHSTRIITAIASLGWLVVGGYAIWEIATSSESDNWEVPYLLFAVGLLIGATLTVAALFAARRGLERSVVRTVGFGVCLLGVVSTIVAWALPLWMGTLGIGFALVAVGSSGAVRRAASMLAGAQALGIVTLFALLQVEIGEQDEYGDYPAVFGIALLVTVA
ncbi:MAG: hypothetical protein MUQ27_13480, partial [Acidimicrobiia bacterium]|nr:hypothetical protein [Acidimicrobiia bacterium]